MSAVFDSSTPVNSVSSQLDEAVLVLPADPNPRDDPSPQRQLQGVESAPVTDSSLASSLPFSAN